MSGSRDSRSGYWRSVGSVLTGTAFAQALTVTSSLVLARLYAPAEFGAYALWLSIVLVIGVVATGRFETALAVIPDGAPRRNAVAATMATAALVGTLGFPLTLIAPRLLPVLGVQVKPVMLSLLMPTAIAFAFSQVWQGWAAADGRYRTLSVLRVAQAAGVGGLQILGGVLSRSSTSLAGAQFAGVLVGLVVAQFAMPLRLDDVRSIGRKTRALWSEHRRFPMLSLPADALNSFTAQLPTMVVTARWGPDAAGYLAMATRVLGGPTALLGKSVLDVFKRHAADAYRSRGNCRAEYLHSLRTLLVGSLVFCTLFALVGEVLMVGVLGEGWRLAARVAIWLLPLYAVRFMASPLSYVVYIAGKQHVDLFWQIALLGMTVATLSVPDSFTGAIKVYSVGYAAMYVVYLWMSYRFSLGADCGLVIGKSGRHADQTR